MLISITGGVQYLDSQNYKTDIPTLYLLFKLFQNLKYNIIDNTCKIKSMIRTNIIITFIITNINMNIKYNNQCLNWKNKRRGTIRLKNN